MNEKFPQASLSNSRFTIHGWNRTGLELSHGTDSSASSGGDSDHGTELRRGGGHRVYLRAINSDGSISHIPISEPDANPEPIYFFTSDRIWNSGVEFEVGVEIIGNGRNIQCYRRVSDGRVFSIKEFGQFELEQRRERLADEQRKLDEQFNIARREREELRQLLEHEHHLGVSVEFGKFNEYLISQGWKPVSVLDLKRK